MDGKTVGFAVLAPDTASALAKIRLAEELGVRSAWLTSGGGGGDALTVLAVAASQTERILLGTSIAQTWARHPVSLAQQAKVIANLAPGRFRLGIGSGHKQAMENMFGAEFRAPLGHLREYIQILKGLFGKGSVDFDGSFYKAHADIGGTFDVPVMASALRTKSFELCGEIADGAISWVCPLQYLQDVALPAMQSGAENAARPAPPLVVHVPVCVNENVNLARDGVREQLGNFPRTVFYSQMFEAAGYPNSLETGWTDDMLDAVLVSGDEATVVSRLKGILNWGASEIIATIVTVGDDKESSAERTMRALAHVSAS